MNLQKELLVELISEWGIEKLNEYLVDLKMRRDEMDKWIRQVQDIRRKKAAIKEPKENGPRDGR